MGGDRKKRNVVVARIAVDCALFGAVLFSPWPVVAIIAIIGVALFRNFYEAVAAGFFLDALYGIEGVTFLHEPIFFTIVFLAGYAAIEIFKRELRTYD